MTLPSDLARELATGSQPPASLPVTPTRRLSSEDSVAHPTELPFQITPISHAARRLSTSTTPSHEQEDNVYSTHPPSSGAARPLLELDEHG